MTPELTTLEDEREYDPEDAEPQDPEIEEDAFTPDTADKVSWVLGKIADARARAARIRENGEALARAEDREADALEWRFGPALQAFLRAETAGGKRKSVRLYHGVIGYRTRPAAVRVTDSAAALEWAKEHLPEAVAETLDKKALTEKLLNTEEFLSTRQVPGFAYLVPAEETFYVR